MVILLAWLMAACAPAGDRPQEAAAQTEAPAVVAQPPTKAPASKTAPTQAPTESPTAEPVAATDYCVDCHSDTDQLIDTANPVEEVVSENKGEG